MQCDKMEIAQLTNIPITIRWSPIYGHSWPVRYPVRFSRAEKKILRKRKKIPPSRWCERHRVLTMSVLPGKWKNSVTPYLTGIMDASFSQSVREITVCAPPQSVSKPPVRR
jgi:hypothetical protein